jgi:hypothetical protein
MTSEQLQDEYYQNFLIMKNYRNGWNGKGSKPYKKYMIDMIENFFVELKNQDLLKQFEEIRPFPIHDNAIQVCALFNSEVYQIDIDFNFFDNSINCCLFYYESEKAKGSDIKNMEISMDIGIKEIIKLIKINFILEFFI